MSTLFGNICLSVAALVSGTLITSVVGYRPPIGGAGGAEAFPIWILLLHIALLCSLGIAAFVIVAHGGFDWIPLHRLGQYLLLGVCVLLAVFTSLMSAFMTNDSGNVPTWIAVLLRYGYIFIPIVLVAAGFMLNNSFLREAVPAALYQWPLAAVLGLSLITAGAGIWDGLHEKSARETDMAYENSPNIKAMRLQEIESADINEQMVRILEFARSVYPAEVREKAVAKIKSHPRWQQEIILLLETERARIAIPFLAAYDVEDPKTFAEPVRKGLLTVAADIRHDIQGSLPSQISKDLFSEYVDCALRVAEKFDGNGVDYLPAVREIRAALDEPTGGRHVGFDCIPVLDAWLGARG